MSVFRKALLAFFLLFPISVFAAVGNLVNAGTLTITTGGTWQTLFALNNNRSTLWIENPCTSTSQGIATAESLFIYFVPTGGSCPAPATTAGAFELTSCGSLVQTPNGYVSQQQICVYSATTAHAFQASQTQ